MEGKTFTKQELLANCWVFYGQIREDEVRLALQIMDGNGDNIAHFGVNGYFLFSEFIADSISLQ